jgi:L-methionine (R)-S-oxide reductase
MHSRQQNYEFLISQVVSIVNGETDIIANMANISSLLFNGIDGINWAGFYLFKESQLVLGPFQGNPAGIRLALGKGVCGTAAETREIQIVKDVHKFKGHIACDSATNSEIVLPIIKNDVLIGVLDLDSERFSHFDANDAEYLTKIVDILIKTISSNTFESLGRMNNGSTVITEMSK